MKWYDIIKAFLDYVDGKGVQDEFTAKLDNRVKFVKMDSGKKAEFMTWQQELIEQQEIGKEKAELDSIIKLLKKNKSIEEIAEWLDFTVERVSMVAKANGFVWLLKKMIIIIIIINPWLLVFKCDIILLLRMFIYND